MKPKPRLTFGQRHQAACRHDCRHFLRLLEAEIAYGNQKLQATLCGGPAPEPPPWLNPDSPFLRFDTSGYAYGERVTAEEHLRRRGVSGAAAME